MMPIFKDYECRECGHKEEKMHPNTSDTTVPTCPNGHGDMSRVFHPVTISGLNKDWMAGKSADYIAGVLNNDFDP